MKIKTVLLILLVLLAGAFGYLKFQFSRDPDTAFNQATRFKLARQPLVRALFGLHNAGDAQAWYFKGNGPIVVNIVKSQKIELSEKILAGFTAELEKVTQRPVRLFNIEFIKEGVLTDVDLAQIEAAKRKPYLPGQPDLFVIFAEDFNAEAKQTGMAYKEFGIVVSQQKIAETASSIAGDPEYHTLAVMLHELGHQLGLAHNDSAGCLMDSRVEQPGQYQYVELNKQPGFCEQELRQLDEIKAKL